MIGRLRLGLWATALLLAGSAPHRVPVQQQLSPARFAEAAKELKQSILQAGPSLKKPAPAQEKVLRREIEAARRFLAERHPAQDQNAARQVLCLSRAYFPEELPGLEKALRVGGAVQAPQLIGKRAQRFPLQARKAGIQGVVIVEAIVDQEGCVRHPRVLKGVPNLDGAALAAVQSWAFQPARLEGEVVAVYYVLSVPFKLSDPD